MRELRTMLVQATLSWMDPAENRSHLRALVDRVDGDFDLAVLPETFTTGYLGEASRSDEGMDGPTLEWMRKLAHDHSCAVCGSAVIVEGGRRFNRFLLVTDQGEVSHYDKRHLFAFAGEDKRYAAGVKRVTIEHHGWRICPQVCYDLRFPAWCRNRGDTDLLIFVANWPQKRVAHWSLLLQARAVENQCFVVGVNRVGEDGRGILYPGASVVHDPMGDKLADLGGEEQCRIVTLDLERVAETQKAFPFQHDADDFELKT